MTKVSPRMQRVADQIQRELALLIQLEVNDPRVGMVSVTGVKVSRDLAHADVYVTVMGSVDGESSLKPGVTLDRIGALDKLEIDESIKALNSAAGYLRTLLAKRLSLRTTPKLNFHFDESVARGQYLSSLIDRAIAEDSEHQS
ncbi:MAG: 30S ribosome-binding factor RbfA [Gammaproteobacteria bacterium]|nr:30S ribosome-binding factor RbfA [Pseudomonadales bacterium]MCP5329496.1 30S ribosome-binding factor RbfA [Pseudomonadales bacterium]